MIKHLCAYMLMFGALGILVSLGTWQLSRLDWKIKIIQNLEATYSNPQNLTWADLQSDDFHYGQVSGKADFSKVIFLGPKTNGDKVGYHAIVPFQVKGGILLANFGWVESQSITMPRQSRLTLTGLIRKPDWTSFTPNNSSENNIWTKPDIAEIAQALALKNVAPNMLYVEKVQPLMPLFEHHEKRWLPRNKHTHYASFWFFMAFVMCVIIGGYSYRLVRRNT